MHKEILSKNQTELLPLITGFSNDFYLVGGTAIALHIGHRQSIDFDLFTTEDLAKNKIKEKIKCSLGIQEVLFESTEELTLSVNNAKITFLKYPYKIDPKESFENVIKLPSLLNLGAMKAFSLGKRAKWKDYVGIFFISKFFSLKNIVDSANNIFQNEFNERLFREQLSYYKDIDYSENIEYMPGFSVDNEEIKQKLTNLSLE